MKPVSFLDWLQLVAAGLCASGAIFWLINMIGYAIWGNPVMVLASTVIVIMNVFFVWFNLKSYHVRHTQ